jgi:hypothetical protein
MTIATPFEKARSICLSPEYIDTSANDRQRGFATLMYTPFARTHKIKTTRRAQWKAGSPSSLLRSEHATETAEAGSQEFGRPVSHTPWIVFSCNPARIGTDALFGSKSLNVDCVEILSMAMKAMFGLWLVRTSAWCPQPSTIDYLGTHNRVDPVRVSLRDTRCACGRVIVTCLGDDEVK